MSLLVKGIVREAERFSAEQVKQLSAKLRCLLLRGQLVASTLLEPTQPTPPHPTNLIVFARSSQQTPKRSNFEPVSS